MYVRQHTLAANKPGCCCYTLTVYLLAPRAHCIIIFPTTRRHYNMHISVIHSLVACLEHQESSYVAFTVVERSISSLQKPVFK